MMTRESHEKSPLLAKPADRLRPSRAHGDLAMIPVFIIERDAESDSWVTASFAASWII